MGGSSMSLLVKRTIANGARDPSTTIDPAAHAPRVLYAPPPATPARHDAHHNHTTFPTYKGQM